MRITVISSGLGQPSSTRLLADRLVSAMRARSRRLDADAEAPQIDVVELREYAHDLLNAELTGFRTPALKEVLDQVAGSDALIAVTPVFNAHPAAVFQLFFEVLDEGALAGTPVLLAATGGTARHSLVTDQALVPLFHYLHAVVAPVSVFAATSDWGDSTALEARIQLAVEAFSRLLGGPADEPAEPSDGAGPQLRAVADDLALTDDFEHMMRALGH